MLTLKNQQAIFDVFREKPELHEVNVQEIMQIVSHNKPIMWSWGAHAFTNIANKALAFKVQGAKFKGIVTVAYDRGLDYYVVFFIYRNKVVKYIPEVFVGELINIID